MVPQPKNGNKSPRPDMTLPQYYRTYPIDEGDEIVISGMSGRFPKSANVAEYANNLYSKTDMLEPSDERWVQLHPEIPKRYGHLSNVDKFDASFFGVHHMQAHTLDPQCRILLEEAYLAVMDSGINPNSLRGTRTGVYVASCFSETEKTVLNDPTSQGSFAITGCSRAMYANRISYTLGLMGPSIFMDTACSSSMFALDVAYGALRSGEIDAAIIGGSSLILHPSTTLHFARLGVLSKTDVCSPFDQNADGYMRSEGVAAIFLQRRRDARRVYGALVHSKTNCDGYKPEGITYPSGVVQGRLLKEFYTSVNVAPDEIGYMEAHSTGTVVGDPEECRAIDNAICKNRSRPLLIGSVKSNIGHTEPTSGICSIIKVLLAFQSGKIAPNMNFKNPRKDIPALQEGRMVVVDEIMDLEKPYVGVSSFGFGGANAHILLKQHDKIKTPGGVPEGSLPYLVKWSGRTKESVERAFKKLESQPLDPEYIALLHGVQEGGINGMLFRGYNVLQGSGTNMPTSFLSDVQHYTGVKRPIVWVFSGMGSQWPGMGAALMQIPLFRQSIQRCHNALKPAGLDLIKILTSDDPKMFDNILHSFIGIAAVQIALTDILKSLGMEPDYIIGHSTGELGCAYADGCFTPEQMILAAYYRGKVSLDAEQIKGSMAAIGLSYKAIRDMVPETIEVACHNGPDSCTISGPAEDVARFVAELKAQKIFAREVPCSNIAYHTRYIAHLGTGFLKYLTHIIPHPKKRSSKWLSTSVPQKNWSRPESLLSSAEYHTNNLLSSVLFEETSALLPPNSLLIEIAPHALLQSILRTSIPNGIYVGLTKRNEKDNHMFFLAALGKLYLNGLDVPLDSLYPKVQWPVTRGTDTISDIIEFDHRDQWQIYSYSESLAKMSGEQSFYINMKTADLVKYLKGHNIDGKILIPATYYLECVWLTYAKMHNHKTATDRPVEFENVKFVRATTLTLESKTELTVMIHFGTGNFEVVEGDSCVVSGTIHEIRDAKQPPNVPNKPFDEKCGEEFYMSAKDFYKELKLRGYYYSDAFKAVESVRGDAHIARLKWDGNWVAFMDCMLQTQILRKDSRDLCLPTKIRKLRIFPDYHMKTISDQKIVEVYSDEAEMRVVGGGIEISGLEISSVQRRKPPGYPVLERYQFVPHFPSPKLTPKDIGRFFIQLALENNPTAKMRLLEVISKPERDPVIKHFRDAIEDLPQITGEYLILSSNTYEDLPADVLVQEGDVSKYRDYSLTIDQTGCEVLKLAASLKENSYIVLVVDWKENVAVPAELSVLAICPWKDSDLKLMLLRKPDKNRTCEMEFLKVSSKDADFQWLKVAQETLATKDLILVSENDKHNGVLGLTNCLRKEYVKTVARCVLIDDAKAPAFDPENPFYANQLALGMAVNVLRKGQWGTYRHLQLSSDYPLEPYTGHVYANILHRGDMSSLKWLQGRQDPQKSQIKVIYSSLNFRDVMLATGRISADIFGEGRLVQDCVLGMEFAGIDKRTGKKVMGMVPKAAVSNFIDEASGFMMNVPDQWSLREAATVPVVYLTVYYAFFIRTDIRKGKSILIHAGTGGIGLSSIRTALAYGLEVFTTVSTAEKRNFLLKTFPQLKESHIGNSRDTSFEDMIRRETKGKGVDFVLNSLAEEKLLASVRCLGRNGVFLEIGKFDMASDNPVGLAPFLRELSFVAVLLDLVISVNDRETMNTLCDMITRDITNGIIQPLPSTVFPAKEVEQAFRFLASGKHIGKVLIQVFESSESSATLPLQVLPVVYFSPELVYVIPGGLGGFGLELIDWMVLRGARKIVVSSSRGITNGYQSYRIQTWRNYGCSVHVNTSNIATKIGCETLLKQAMAMGPVGGIFNLAVILKDALFENQNVDFFKETSAPKAIATVYLDELSRKLCPKLKHFLIFSSVSCGRGNAGQTNYGMANSIMERIIEDRVANGFRGKAIQWGAVGEVGLVAVMAEDKIDLEIGGTIQQRISSCLQELDTLLSSPHPLVASMVVAEKRSGLSGATNLLETVMKIMSIRDIQSVSHDLSLSELGMDSLMAVDIKQTLEREFDLFLSPQDLRSLTFQKLQEYSMSHAGVNKIDEAGGQALIQDLTQQTHTLVRHLGDESNFRDAIVAINEVEAGNHPIFTFTGVEGTSGHVWSNLGKAIEAPMYVIQLNNPSVMGSSFDEIAEFAVEKIKGILKPGDEFRIVGYSLGTVVAIKVVHLLEKLGHTGRVVFIDGSPTLMTALFKIYAEAVGKENVEGLVLANIVALMLPDVSMESAQATFLEIESLEGRLIAFQKYVRQQNTFSEEYAMTMVDGVLQRTRLVQQLDLSTFDRVAAPICLLKPTTPTLINASKDYDLGLLTNSDVTIQVVEGNHASIIQNPELPKIINKLMLTDQFKY